jgi:hypothetical protein
VGYLALLGGGIETTAAIASTSAVTAAASTIVQQKAEDLGSFGSFYELWLSRDDGTRLALLDQVVRFDYAIVLHGVGACRLELPGSTDKSLLAVDRRIEVWRSAAKKALTLERVYLIRRIADGTDADGLRTIVITGLDGNHLLRRRIVAYAAGSAQAEMTDQADDLCRAIVVDNLGADAAAARQIGSTYLAIAPEGSDGASMTMGFSRRNVLAVLQDIANTAEAAGTPVYWHMADRTAAQWEFRTYTGQPGDDHSYPDGTDPVLLGLEYGNLAEPKVEEDYTEEITYAYAGGQGEGTARVIETAEDAARSGRSLFGRCEGFADARNESATAGVTAAARRLLGAGEPRRRFAAKLVNSAGTLYGVHWRWGDRVTAAYAGETYTAIIRAVAVRLDENGLETIDARLEMVD